MTETLYGAKCHRCGHIRHDGDCASCSFCAVDAFLTTIEPHGLGMFDPEVRRAVHALRRGDSDPLIGQLRTECQALDLTVRVGAQDWRVVDAQLHVSEVADSQHLHLTLTPADITVTEADPGACSADTRGGADVSAPEPPAELRARLTNEERAEGRRDLTFPWNGPWRLWLLKHGEALLDAADDVTRLEAERDALLARLTAAEAVARLYRMGHRPFCSCHACAAFHDLPEQADVGALRERPQ